MNYNTLFTENIRDIYDSLLLAQKEAKDEGNDVVDSLTDTHLANTISDLFGGKSQSNFFKHGCVKRIYFILDMLEEKKRSARSFLKLHTITIFLAMQHSSDS